MNFILAWHFAPADMRLPNGDGREIRDGEILTVEGPPVLCRHGLHASRRILDALEYAPSRTCICRVRLSGEIVHGGDKMASTSRECLWHLDADTTDAILRAFSRRCALDVIVLWDAPEIVVRYLRMGDESIRAAARDAALAAALAAARAAARAAAGAAARKRQNARLAAMALAAHRRATP